MDRVDNNETASLLHNDSISIATGATKCNNGNTFTERALLLRYLQRGISETTEENIVFTKENTGLLSKLNFDVKALPNDIKEGLEKLSLILKSEKLLEFDETALCVAKERKIIEEKRQQREEKKMSLIHDNLLRSCTRLQTRLDHSQDAINSINSTLDIIKKDKDNLYCNKVFLSTKMKEYQQAVDKLETDLDDMQIDELYPEHILNKYKLYLENVSKLGDLNKPLSRYNNLPPNLLQAKLLVESKRKEYESLEQQLLEKTQ